MNARQKRLFEESRKKNPDLKMPTEEVRSSAELTDADLALIKQGVGDKTSRPHQATTTASDGTVEPAEQFGAIVTYFEEKGFGFLRPESGGRDVFFHISRLVEAQASDLTPGTRVNFELGMDRTGKMAASMVKLAAPATPAPVPAAEPPATESSSV